MYCTYCGKKLPDRAKFCSCCGRQLNNVYSGNKEAGNVKANSTHAGGSQVSDRYITGTRENSRVEGATRSKSVRTAEHEGIKPVFILLGIAAVLLLFSAVLIFTI